MNTRKEIKLYNLDLTGKSKLNKVDFEYNKRSTAKHNDIFVVRGGPFYKESFRLLNMQGLAYTYGKDYEFYGHMSKLTEYTGKEVGLFVRLKNKNITEWQTMYQVVGNFGVVGSEILKMMISITEDDRLIDWNDIENKPLWFDPLPHIHDLTYEIFNFSDLTDQLYRIIGTLQDGPQIDTILLAKIQDQVQFYCEQYKAKFREIIASHDGSGLNNHGAYKEDIGLGLVDNFPIATVEEALDGTAQNRFLTPQLANRVITEASGRNDLLYPGGSLPMLRYGNDSFIPPKIDGSFEGMGAEQQRCGAIVEPSGELLILTARTNGVTKGLYFVSGTDWDTEKPKWSFTGYQYTHPTITADGATLDFIMNGSNRYYMIVGDTTKGFYYGIETNGTFNPAKHSPKRLTGHWMNAGYENHRATLLADSYYKKYVCILQPLRYSQCKILRPSLPSEAETGYGTRDNDGFVFYVIKNNGSAIENCNIKYTTAAGDTFNEALFTPYLRKMISVPGKGNRIESHFAKFIGPDYPKTIWAYHTVDGTWRYNPDTDRFELMFYFRVWGDLDNLKTFSWVIMYRAAIKIEYISSVPNMTMETKDYEKKQYSFNIDNPGNTQDFSDFLIEKTISMSTGGFWEIGTCNLKNGYHVLLGFNGRALPNKILIRTIPWENSPSWMGPGYQLKAEFVSDKVCYDVNPLGLSTGFINQIYMTADTDNYQEAGVIAKQPTKNGEHEWIYRKLSFSAADWSGHGATETVNVAGVTCSTYVFDNTVRKVNLGQQLVFSLNGLARGTLKDGQRQRYRRSLGADAFSNILGQETCAGGPDDVGNQGALNKGDGLLVDQLDVKIVNGVVTYIPKVVFNIRKAIDTQIRKILTDAGVTTNNLISGWTIMQYIENNTGNTSFILKALEITGPTELRVSFVNLQITGAGTPTTDRGYTYYDDLLVTKISSVKSMTLGTNPLVDSDIRGWKFIGEAYHSGQCLSFANSSIPAGNGKVVVMRSIHGVRVTSGNVSIEAVLEVLDNREIGRISLRVVPYVNVDEGFICSPGAGQGYRANLPNGKSGIIANTISNVGDTFLNVVNRTVDSNRYWLGMSNIIKSQWTIYFQEMKDAVLSGKNYDIPGGYIDLRTIDPSPANKTFYVYLEYYEGKVGYKIYKDVKPESASRGLIANVTCGATQIATVTPWNRFSLDGVTWNINRAGSSIPVSVGTQFEIGNNGSFFNTNDYLPE